MIASSMSGHEVRSREVREDGFWSRGDSDDAETCVPCNESEHSDSSDSDDRLGSDRCRHQLRFSAVKAGNDRRYDTSVIETHDDTSNAVKVMARCDTCR
jgi:hypothetical protein